MAVDVVTPLLSHGIIATTTPAVGDVRSGTGYGIDATEFTGTLAVGTTHTVEITLTQPDVEVTRG